MDPRALIFSFQPQYELYPLQQGIIPFMPDTYYFPEKSGGRSLLG